MNVDPPCSLSQYFAELLARFYVLRCEDVTPDFVQKQLGKRAEALHAETEDKTDRALRALDDMLHL
ncbi:MAG TPA: hypothetical protein PKX87_08590 [Alphaproteobacteria bacterium]|nr:hypothetical protein [Alphaproteobacteria bacterium]